MFTATLLTSMFAMQTDRLSLISAKNPKYVVCSDAILRTTQNQELEAINFRGMTLYHHHSFDLWPVSKRGDPIDRTRSYWWLGLAANALKQSGTVRSDNEYKFNASAQAGKTDYAAIAAGASIERKMVAAVLASFTPVVYVHPYDGSSRVFLPIEPNTFKPFSLTYTPVDEKFTLQERDVKRLFSKSNGATKVISVTERERVERIVSLIARELGTDLVLSDNFSNCDLIFGSQRTFSVQELLTVILVCCDLRIRSFDNRFVLAISSEIPSDDYLNEMYSVVKRSQLRILDVLAASGQIPSYLEMSGLLSVRDGYNMKYKRIGYSGNERLFEDVLRLSVMNQSRFNTMDEIRKCKVSIGISCSVNLIGKNFKAGSGFAFPETFSVE
jgi:hypothetical protein